MVSVRMRGVVGRLRQTAWLASGGLSDADLLERYVSRKDEAAFATLVRRLGPMVLGVCRRILRDPHDADDAFQATFLVLVRKAHQVMPRERVGSWLYGVAYRTSLKARAMSIRRRAQHKPLDDLPGPASAGQAPAESEWLALLDEAVHRLPDKYRLPVVLCDLQGKTRKQAARELNCPEGTVATRLQQGRARVQKRLARHGWPASVGVLTLAASEAAATVPAPLVTATLKTAALFSAGKVTGLVPLKIITLVEGVLRAMVLGKIKKMSLMLTLVGALGIAGLVGGSRSVAGQDAADDKAPPPPAVKAAEPATPAVPERNDGRLPIGPIPLQALVSLDKNKIVVKMNHPIAQPKQVVDAAGRPLVTTYEVIYTLHTQRYERSEVEVYDTSRRKLDGNDLAKRVKDEIPVLVVIGAGKIDPLHLRLIKEGTLIFVLPARCIPPAAAPSPAVPPMAAYPPAAGDIVQYVPALPAPMYQPPIGVPPLTPTETVPYAPAVPPPAPVQPYAVPPPAQPAPAFTPVRVPPASPVTPPAAEPRNDQAERDLSIAAFYLVQGHRGSAAFYYELVCRRYPGTTYAQRAAQLLVAMNAQDKQGAQRPPARVGEIIIVGADKIPDTTIRANVPLLPGQIFEPKDMALAETKLNQAKWPVPHARFTVTMVSTPGTHYHDILIKVQESLSKEAQQELKKLAGRWTVVAASVGGAPRDELKGAEFIFVADRITMTFNNKETHISLKIDPRERTFSLTPSEGSGASCGSYELQGDALKLCVRPDSGPPRGSSEPRMDLILKRVK
jgi:RNA polymerase sigma factor (sigma-70 family)